MKGEFATFENEVEILKNTFGSHLIQRVISISIITKINHFKLFKYQMKTTLISNGFEKNYGYLILLMRCQ
jgi:hypothetical protein